MFSLQRYFYLKRAVFLRSTKFGSETWGAVILQVYRMWSLPTGYVVSDVLSKTCHQSRVRSHKGCRSPRKIRTMKITKVGVDGFHHIVDETKKAHEV